MNLILQMIQPIKYSDDPLWKNIPETATRFEYGNIIIVILHPEKKEFDWLLINKENRDFYYHMYQERGEAYFHKTKILKNGRKKHESIDLEKSIKQIGEIVSEFFSKAEKVELNDDRFIGKIVYFLGQQKLYVQEKNKKKVIFGQNYDVDEISFEKIDKTSPKLGILFDENDKEKEMIFVQNGNIFRLDLKHFEELEKSNSTIF